MSKPRWMRFNRILNVISSMTVTEKIKLRTQNDDFIEENSETSSKASSPRRKKKTSKSNSTATEQSANEKCPICDSASSCRHDVTFECVPNEVRKRDRISSTTSSELTAADDVCRSALRRSVSVKEESSRCMEEVELTDEQKEELKQAFSMFEKAGKGRIPARDLGELLRCLGWNPSEQDLEEARHELELTTRGSLSYAEVEAYVAKRGGLYYANNAEEDIMVAFQVLDKTGSGRITVSDFRHFLTTMGERMSHEEAEELIARTIQDGKDYIEYRDLVLAVQHLPT